MLLIFFVFFSSSPASPSVEAELREKKQIMSSNGLRTSRLRGVTHLSNTDTERDATAVFCISRIAMSLLVWQQTHDDAHPTGF